MDFKLESEFIRMDDLLKCCSLVSSGGMAKIEIQNGGVTLNGEVCTQRGRKIRVGDVVCAFDETITVK